MPKATNDATDARAATPAVPGNDAELIRLCDRLIALEAQFDSIYATVEDDDEAERQSGLLILDTKRSRTGSTQSERPRSAMQAGAPLLELPLRVHKDPIPIASFWMMAAAWLRT